MRFASLGSASLGSASLGSAILGSASLGSAAATFGHRRKIDRGFQRLGVGARFLRCVVSLDQQPVVLPPTLVGPRLQPHQGELPMQPRAGQDELDLAVAKPLVGVDQRLPNAAVPGRDRPGAVVALRDAALEVGVIQRVVLDMHGDSLVGRVERGAFAHRPAPQHVIVLQAEIPVQPGAVRQVLLHHEDRRPLARPRCNRRGRLRRRGEVTLRAVGLDRGVAGRPGHASPPRADGPWNPGMKHPPLNCRVKRVSPIARRRVCG